MSDYLLDGYRSDSAAVAPQSERVAFIQRTYAHLGGAVIAFVVLLTMMYQAGLGVKMLKAVSSAGAIGWIGIMLLFIGGGYVAQMMASSRDRSVQYMGLAGYTLLEAVFFLPIITIGESKFPGVAKQAGVITLTVFGGLTAAVLLSKKDFSFLGFGLKIASFAAFGLVIAAIIGGFGLGLWFSFLMVAVACGFILYDTSNVLHHYGTDQHVGAALALFASLATLFYYILRIMYATQNSD